MTSLFRIAVMASAALGLGLSPMQRAEAHGVESSLRYLDGQLQLTSSFSTGEPVEGAVVRLMQADGTPGEELGRIDAEGQLTMTLPALADGLVDLHSFGPQLIDLGAQSLIELVNLALSGIVAVLQAVF